MKLKKLLPRSLFGRFLLIITIPTLIVQIVAIYVFFYVYVDVISKYMARSVVSEMSFVQDVVNQEKDLEIIKDFSRNVDLNFYFEGRKGRKKTKIADSKWRRNKIYEYVNFIPVIDPLNRFKSELKGYGLSPYEIFQDIEDSDILIVKTQTDNGVLSFEVPAKRIDNSSGKYVFIAWMVATAFITSIISIIFLKNQLRPINSLSKAAEKFGRGQDAPNFRPSGSSEVRSVAISFVKMKERIIRQISQRTDMLSAVSHDLRTPLTRMKLQLEMMAQGEEVEALKNDIDDMSKLVEEYLDFARFEEREKKSPIKIRQFLKEKVAKYYQDMNKNIDFETNISSNFKIMLKKLAFKRALINLVDNAFNYGNKALVRANLSDNNLIITIEDDGLGIPESEYKNVFKPFYRIDGARNQDKDNKKQQSNMGSGLGLAIAMDAITSHGGRIKLSESRFKGLKVSIFIPI